MFNKIKKIFSEQKPRSSAFEVKVQNPRNIYNLYTSEFSGLTSEQIKFYLEAARKGLNFFKGLLFEEIRSRDLRIGGICQTRKLAPASKEWKVETNDIERQKFIADILNNIDLQHIITSIIEAQIQGVTMFEINWDIINNRIVPIELRRIPNWLLAYDDIQDEYKILDAGNTDLFQMKISTVTTDDRIDLSGFKMIDIDERKLLEVESSDNMNPNGFRNGCIDGLIWIYFLKNYGLKDYATYLELFGNPMRIGKYDPLNSNPATEQKLINAVKEFGNLSWAVLSNDMSIEFPVEPGKASTSDLFKNYLNYLDEEIAIRVLGQTLTSSIGERGSYAAAAVHNAVRNDILLSDLALCERKINELIRKIIDLNFSDNNYPVFRFISDENLERKKLLSEIITNLKTAGYETDAEAIISDIGLPVKKSIVAEFAEKKKPKTADMFDLDNYLDSILKEVQ